MNDETKRNMLKLIETLPDYLDPAWDDDLDGIKCDVGHVKRRLLEIVQPSNPAPTPKQFRNSVER